MNWREPLPATKRGQMSRSRAAEILAEQDGKCLWCDEPITEGQSYQIDHRIAIELGGSNDRENLQALHDRPCHLRKTASDRRKIAKVHRLQKREASPPPPSRFPSRRMDGRPVYRVGG